jgi:hypothetical protein
LTCEYLREFSKKFEMVLMEYSGAGGKLIHEKNQKKKSRDTLPFKGYTTSLESMTKVFLRVTTRCLQIARTSDFLAQ